MTTVAMHESKVLLTHECVTTVIRNPLLRLGLERILDDLGLARQPGSRCTTLRLAARIGSEFFGTGC